MVALVEISTFDICLTMYCNIINLYSIQTISIDTYWQLRFQILAIYTVNKTVTCLCVYHW